MKKPMASYKSVSRGTLAIFMTEAVFVVACAIVFAFPFVIGLAYLPEMLEKRDGVKHMNIYGIRG